MQPSVTLSALCLVAAVLCYGSSSLLLSQGSHAVRGRVYLLGLAFQALAFLLAFVARVELPLLVVQAAVAASVAVTAVAGAALGRWRLTGPDGAALVAVIAGIALVGSASQAGRVELGRSGPLLAAAAVAVLALVGVVAGLGATPLGALAGLAYGSSAVAARALAGDPLAAVRSPVPPRRKATVSSTWPASNPPTSTTAASRPTGERAAPIAGYRSAPRPRP